MKKTELVKISKSTQEKYGLPKIGRSDVAITLCQKDSEISVDFEIGKDTVRNFDLLKQAIIEESKNRPLSLKTVNLLKFIEAFETLVEKETF